MSDEWPSVLHHRWLEVEARRAAAPRVVCDECTGAFRVKKGSAEPYVRSIGGTYGWLCLQHWTQWCEDGWLWNKRGK